MSTTQEPESVSVSLNYFNLPASGEKPYSYLTPPPEGTPKTNWTTDPRTVEITNLRGKENEVSLDTAGFQFGTAPSVHKAFVNDADIRREYYPESEELLKRITGASRVVLFDHTLRRRSPGDAGDSPDKRQPATQVHVDQTTAAAVTRVHQNLPAKDAEEVLRRRFQIINLWRPIGHAAYDWPLALCDYRTVNAETELVPSKIVFPTRVGENVLVKHSSEHRWKYLRGMRPDEFVLIKCYDSKEGVAVFTPHTAFPDPSAPTDAPFRESIELRALVFYE